MEGHWLDLMTPFVKVYYPDLLKMPAKLYARMAELYDEGLKYVSILGVVLGQ